MGPESPADQDLEVPYPDAYRLHAVRNRVRRPFQALQGAGSEGAEGVIRRRGLDAYHPHRGVSSLDRRVPSADLAAAADRAGDGGKVARVFQQFQGAGALAVDDVPIVVWVDEGVSRPLLRLDQLFVAVGK